MSFFSQKICAKPPVKSCQRVPFKAIVGSPCSYDHRGQSKSLNEVPLLSCVKDIERHKSLWSFTGVTGEQELILVRAGIFTTQQDVSDLTICPFHRSELGIGWQRSSNTCKFQMTLHITVRVKEIQSL